MLKIKIQWNWKVAILGLIAAIIPIAGLLLIVDTTNNLNQNFLKEKVLKDQARKQQQKLEEIFENPKFEIGQTCYLPSGALTEDIVDASAFFPLIFGDKKCLDAPKERTRLTRTYHLSFVHPDQPLTVVGATTFLGIRYYQVTPQSGPLKEKFFYAAGLLLTE